jgi:hypothetical protein
VGRTPSDFEDAGAGTGAVIAVKRPGGAGVSGISGSRLNEVGEKLEGGGGKALMLGKGDKNKILASTTVPYWAERVRLMQQ